jgi:Cysteine dioxygenase type I
MQQFFYYNFSGIFPASYFPGKVTTLPASIMLMSIIHCSRYTRNLVDTGNGKYNLLALCWGEGHGSGVHDHSDAHCFVKMLDGTLKETRFSWPEVAEGQTKVTHFEDASVLTPIGECFVEKNGVAYINGKHEPYHSKVERKVDV